MSTKGKIAPRFAGGGALSCTRVLALFLAFLLSFSLISEPLQVYASTLTSPEVSGGSEDSPYEVGADTKIFETTAIDQTVFTVEVQDDEILDDAVLVVDLLDPESDEYADAMLSAWISYDIDPDKDLFEMVPYDVYFKSANGDRIDYSGSATVTMEFAGDLFADNDNAQKFVSYMTPLGESTKVEFEEIDSGIIQFDIPKLSTFGPAILSKAPLAPGQAGSIGALADLPKDEVGAAYEVPEVHMLGMVGGENWYFDIYYVGEDDYYYVEYNHDFNLKYQIEVHVDQDYEAGEIEIRVPKALFNFRDGTPLVPTSEQIAVPAGRPEAPTQTASSQFNYYEDTDTGELVFFNYCKIVSGTNNAWQVLYKNVDVMEVVDGTTWNITATATVKGEEPKSAMPLGGMVDTSAVLTSVSKVAYSNTGASYGPGLYTENQVKQYVDTDIPEWCSGTNFTKFKYVLWQISLKTSASQPYSIQVKETMDPAGGKIVGGSTRGYSWASKESYLDKNNFKNEDGVWLSLSKTKSMNATYYIVVAYPEDSVEVGDLVKNTVEFTVHPIDGVDADTTKSAAASWKYEDYQWIYSGDIIRVDKWTPVETQNGTVYSRSQTFPGWLEAYKGFRNNGQVDQGVSLPFELRSISRSFKLTHDTVNSTSLGKRKEGMVTRVTTMDDAVYVIPNSGTGEMEMLTSEDYYFERVEIVQTDQGYDVWEDNYDTPEGLEPSETDVPGLEIYAMFADKGGDGTTNDQWEKVATVGWNSSGILKYTFTPAQIARHPYRVKVVHDTINYVTYCNIDVDVHILVTSPKVNKILDEDINTASIQFENVAGVTGLLLDHGEPYDFGGYPSAVKGQDSSYGWYHDYLTENGNYSEKDLIEFSAKLYDVLPMRDCAFAFITPIEEHAKAVKTHTASNDIVNGRLNVIYNLTAHDGWKIGNREIADALIQNNVIESPGRSSVAFYDLLPYGMQFDPSYEIIAGRVTNIQNEEKEEWVNPKSWNTADVSVTAEVISTDYEGTNRTLVKFLITYTGTDDPTSLTRVYDAETKIAQCDYFEGWGVSFQGYFTWDNVIYSDKTPNICAFMPAPGDSRQLHGAAGEVYNDDGNYFGLGDYALFGEDIDDDPATQDKCVLFADELVLDDSVTASRSDITKMVRADSNDFGPFEKFAIVEPGGTYTYEITVKNTAKDIKGIVVFDRLERANEDRLGSDGRPLPNEPDFADTVWHGTFLSIMTDQLADFEIEPVIWYNARRDAPIPSEEGTDTPADILTPANGWFKASEFDGEVQAIAVDLSHMKGGLDFVLESGKSVSFRIHMKAPDTSAAEWTYNNPSFYRDMAKPEPGDQDKHFVVGNSVQVKFEQAKTLEILKEFKNEVPEDVQKDLFTMFLTETIGSGEHTETHKFSDRVYKLYTWKDNTWIQESKDQILTTGADGIVTLQAGQKAVFENIASASVINVTEEESPFWDVTVTKNTNSDPYTITVQNEFKPVLYVQKRIDKIPDTDRGQAALKNDEFTFQVTVDGKPAANVPYWYVKNVRTDGGIPQRVTGASGKDSGTTDETGRFTLKYGDIVAIIGSGVAGMPYTVTEVDASNSWENWICENNTVSGNLQLRGSSAVITNIYKWRSFLLTKSIQYQDLEDAKDVAFTFKVEKKVDDDHYEVVTGNTWTLLDENMQESGITGTLSSDGTFSCNLAGKYVRIDALEADTTYRITEIKPTTMDGKDVFGVLYEPVKDSDEWKMPLHALTSSGEFTNNWRMRPLYVTKTVTYDSKSEKATWEANNAEFEMLVEVDRDTDNDGIPDTGLKPLANFPYQIIENGEVVDDGQTEVDGTFIIKNNQTIYFKDAGLIGAGYRITETNSGIDFEQTFPLNKQPSVGKLGINGTEESPASFVNGTTSAIMIQKEYVFANYDAEYFYWDHKYDESGKNPLEVSITIRAFTKTESYIWPAKDTNVAVFDEDGNPTIETWYKGKSFNLLPDETVVLQNGIDDENVIAFVVTESAADRQWLQVCDDYGCLIECTQTYPEKAASYEVGTVRSVTLVNTLSSHEPNGSAIIKDMAPGSNQVPDYATLTLILEKKSGEEWIPAEGIQYYIGKYTHGDTEVDWKNLDTDQTFTTGPDGLIQITKTENGYPFLQFLKDQVYVYGDTMTPTVDGTLRIRELLDQSDSAWGKFAWNSQLIQGQQFEAQWQKTEGPRGEPYDTIVNSNRTTKVRVGKDSSSESNQDFTFYLNQIIGVDWSKAPTGLSAENHKDAITSLVPAKGIVYYIQERDEEGHVTTVSGPHELGSDGKFTIKAGQYAEFDLPDKTMWTVYEEVTPGFYLDSMVAIEGEVYTTPLDDNTMLISSIAGVFGDRITATSKQYAWDLGAELDPDQFDVTFYDSNGGIRPLKSEEFTLNPAYAPDVEGKFTVTVTDNATGLTTKVVLYAGEPYDVKYAVRIYGILVDDTDQAGKKAGLTFGPATGPESKANYTDNKNGRNLCGHKGPEGICISDLTWDEIIKQVEDDPTVFEECMKAGCVVSVKLNLSDELISSTDYHAEMDSGDGASILYESINSEYRKWNYEYDGKGGWRTSRIRATLNGFQDGETNLDVAGAKETNLTEDNCLFAAFPEELKTAIVPKVVKSDSKRDSFDPSDVDTTYDNLWLFSADEIFAYDPGGSYNNNYLRYENGKTNEGPQYPANQYMGITAANYRNNVGFTESGSASSWWLRSLYRGISSNACYVGSTGRPNFSSVNNGNYGLAPGFCIGYCDEPYTVKYAVRIYGILTDATDRPGQAAGLTFGPATGKSYVDNKDPLNPCPLGDGCISNMTWTEIIAKAQTDPNYFEPCMKNGCVVSVPLNITGRLAGESFKGKMDDGYGASALYDSINSEYRKWNTTNSNAGGWPASRIRATLNGKDSETDINGVAGTDCLTADQSLFAAFPQVLQDAIVSKAVKSDTVYNKFDAANVKPTYDKLWLFSGAEVYADSGSNNDVMRLNNGVSNEGSQYSGNSGITTSLYNKNIAYNEAGSSNYWWLRSLDRYVSSSVYSVSGSGVWGGYDASITYLGLAPGFCIVSLPAPPDPYTVKYAVRIYGINVDQCKDAEGNIVTALLTFGPATGKNWTSHLTPHACSKGDACISNMTWPEIIAKAREDASYFKTCMENGCPVSVPLNIDGLIAGTSYAGKMSGYGASILYDSINSNYCKWNNTNDNTGGWPASRIRAVLNGYQAGVTNTSVAGEDITTITASQSLFAAFPQELQDAIVAKEVRTCTNCRDLNNSTQTTYDMLWLFSNAEMYSGTNVYKMHPDEGPQYPGNSGITLSSYNKNVVYSEDGYNCVRWSRSLDRGRSDCACRIDFNGNPDNSSPVNYSFGLAPGFCIR